MDDTIEHMTIAKIQMSKALFTPASFFAVEMIFCGIKYRLFLSVF
jgi:hypothetical protein